MPDEARRAEADVITPFQHSPAYIHIVAGLMENRIEAANFQKYPPEEGHVAAGHMLRFAVGHHDVRRPSRRCHHRRSHRGIFWRKKIMSAYPVKMVREQIANQII